MTAAAGALRATARDPDVAAVLAADEGLRGANAELRAATVSLRRIAREEGGAADSARLRLASFCLDALRAAAAAHGREKAPAANRCLYALYDADPAPYFAPDARARPPDPPWTTLRDGALGLLHLARGPLQAPCARIADDAEAELVRLTAKLPAPILPSTAALPELPAGAPRVPYDRAPIVRVAAAGVFVDGLPFPPGLEDDARQALAETFAEYRSTRATLVAAPETPWARVLDAAELALRAGAVLVDFAGAEPLDARARIPPDDWLATVPHPARMAGLPVTVYTLRAGARPPPLPRDFPRGVLYHPDHAPRGLTLVVAPDSARLLDRDGAQVAGDLAALESSHGADRGLLVRASGDLPYAVVFGAIARAAQAFPEIALAPAP